MAGKILVVDDESPIVELVATLLTRKGYSVITSLSGTDGLRLSKEQRPDAIILDIVMPDLDGIQFAEEIRADPATNHIPIIFLTGMVKNNEVPNDHTIGGNHFLAKPFNSEILLRLLEQVMG